MKTSETLDIPHVKITDHKISIHNHDNQNLDTILDSVFLGLECVNNDIN